MRGARVKIVAACQICANVAGFCLTFGSALFGCSRTLAGADRGGVKTFAAAAGTYGRSLSPHRSLGSVPTAVR
jgi:hypothetical protein